jgi:type II secretory pathway pseudopilin PulG
MKDHTPIRQAKKPSEEGYVLLGAIILLALFVIAMAVAAPVVAKSIQRDREIETMHRGKQYIRAIQLYYRKFNAYPPNIDALEKTNEIRYLRKRYTDPMTGKDDWKPIFYCQNKTPIAMGFFGQPLGAAGCGTVAGTGPGGVGSTVGQPIGSGFGGQQTPTDPNNPQSPQSPGLGGSQSSTFGGSQDSGFGGTQSPGLGGSQSPGPGGSSGSSGITGLGGDTGMTVGGAVIGVSPASTKQSILVYKKKNHYNEWEFLYSPLVDQPGAFGMGTGTTGLPTNGTGGTGTQQNNNGFGFGNSPGNTPGNSPGTNNGNTNGSSFGNGGLQPPQ